VCREWTEDLSLWVQPVSSMPATRLEVVALQEELDRRLQQRQARETGICPVRRELYTQCFGQCLESARSIATRVAWSVCLSVCWSQGCGRPGRTAYALSAENFTSSASVSVSEKVKLAHTRLPSAGFRS